jgi:hypothetical protein
MRSNVVDTKKMSVKGQSAGMTWLGFPDTAYVGTRLESGWDVLQPQDWR